MALQNVEANITLDLYNHDTTPATVKAIQLDSQTRYVAAMLQSMGAEYGLDSGATVQLIVIRPDKVGVQITGTTFTYGDEGAQFLGPYAELTQVALAVNGKMRGQFKITSGTQILRTEIFAISNGEALDASTDEWAGDYDGYNLDELVEKVDNAVDKVDGMEEDVTELKSGLNDAIMDGYMNNPPVSNGSFNRNGTYATNVRRIRTNFIPVKIGDKIVIHNGSLKHACGAWNGTLSEATNIRNDGSFNTSDETIISEVNGYYIVVLAKQDATQTVSVNDFDGYIHVYNNEIYRNSENCKELKEKIDFIYESITNENDVWRY